MKEQLKKLISTRKILVLGFGLAVILHSFVNSDFNNLFEQLATLTVGFYFGSSQPVKGE